MTAVIEIRDHSRLAFCRTFGKLFLVASVGLNAGCTELGTQSRVNPISAAAYKQPADSPECPLVSGIYKTDREQSIDLSCFRFPESPVTLVSGDKSIQMQVKGTAYSLSTIDKTSRNRLTSILIKQSDDICSIQLGELTADEATANTALSIANSGLSIASSIVGGDLAKSILSGSAAFAGASRDHINVHVYRNAVAQSISKVIWAKRTELRNAITAKYNEGAVSWTIDDAIRAVNEYHQQCSLSKGLDLLAAAATNSGELAAAKAGLLQESCVGRLNYEIFDIEAAIDRAAGDDKKSLQARANELRIARSKIGTDGEGSTGCSSNNTR